MKRISCSFLTCDARVYHGDEWGEFAAAASKQGVQLEPEDTRDAYRGLCAGRCLWVGDPTNIPVAIHECWHLVDFIAEHLAMTEEESKARIAEHYVPKVLAYFASL